MKSAITLAQVPEAKAGPFVFHQALPDSFATAASLGFDAVELFLPARCRQRVRGTRTRVAGPERGWS